jgi:hypothetical protein
MDNFYLETQVTPYSDTSFGAISLYVFSGTAPFTYLLNGDTTSSQISGLEAGSYTVTVIDGNGCIQEETIVIQNLSTLNINEQLIQLYPNLIASGENINITGVSQFNHLIVYNSEGKKVTLVMLHDHGKVLSSDALYLEPGVYYFIIKNRCCKFVVI